MKNKRFKGIEELDTFKIQVEVPVQWGEMDAANHVNNVIYLRWVEVARIKYFEETNVSSDFTSTAGPILAWQDCKYIFPVTYPDTMLIGVRCAELLEDRIKLETKLFSQKHQRITAVSTQIVMAYNYQTLKKAPVPESWVEGIKNTGDLIK